MLRVGSSGAAPGGLTRPGTTAPDVGNATVFFNQVLKDPDKQTTTRGGGTPASTTRSNPQLLSESKYKKTSQEPKTSLAVRNKVMLFEDFLFYLWYRGETCSSKILCIRSHAARRRILGVFVTKILKPFFFFFKFSTKKNTKHYKALSNYFF